jgi:hypothetical protein
MAFGKHFHCSHIALPRRSKSGGPSTPCVEEMFLAAAKARTYQSQVAGAEEF